MSMRSVLMIVGPEYEELELWYPKYRLEAAGYLVPVAGIGLKSYLGEAWLPLRGRRANLRFRR